MSDRTLRFELTGMSCANCAGTIEERVGGLDGVDAVDANYATDEGAVSYDPDAVSLGDIVAAVEDAGYGVDTETVTVPITDLSCANCAEANADALEGVTGVVAAEVNYATDEAQVTYVPAAASLSALYDAIEDAGYTPVTETLSVAITDMTCTNCADTVGSALERTPGVVDAHVNAAVSKYSPVLAMRPSSATTE